jgi:hypothetical protein
MLDIGWSPGDTADCIGDCDIDGIDWFCSFLSFKLVRFTLDILLQDFRLNLGWLCKLYFSNLGVTIVHHLIQKFVNNDEVVSDKLKRSIDLTWYSLLLIPWNIQLRFLGICRGRRKPLQHLNFFFQWRGLIFFIL